ncbi:cobaltochelatase subunit CobN [Pseudomonas aeruginosa]|nr:cobaltochelatase subunit CobN [Pseudomonas aeruginosa]
MTTTSSRAACWRRWNPCAARAVASYHGDHSQPDNPRIRTLKEELNRVVRARAVNPGGSPG